MFKKLFYQMMIPNICVIFLSLVLTGAVVLGFLTSYTIDEKTETLDNVAGQIADMTVQLKVERQDSVYDRIYQDNLGVFEQVIGADIFIINTDNMVVARTARLKELRKIDSKYSEQIFSEARPVKFTGTMGGIFKQRVFSYAYPVIYEDKVIGAVYLNVTMPTLNEYRSTVFRYFIFTSLVVLLVAILFVYVFSKRITNKIKDLSNAAYSIAAGNFKSRVAVTSEDEIGQLAATFNYMADSLQKLDDMQTSFIANISHELRTPMTTIGGFIENILDGTIPYERQNEYLQIALSETKRLARLVGDMLDISKMSLGQYTLEMQNFDINEMLRLSIIQFESVIEDSKLDVDIDFSNDKLRVVADKDAITRVITNLMDNAIKFSDPASCIRIKTFSKGAKAYVAISNDGVGIDEHELDFVFDRFYKTDKSRSVNKKGTGIGLYMVKNLLNLHNESIVVKSIPIPDSEYEGNPNHPQKRTTFVFSLKIL